MLYINCISMKLEKKCLSSKCECSCPLPLRNSKPPVALGLSQRSCTFGSVPLHTAPSPWASPAALSLLGWCALSASLERLPGSPVVQMLLPLRPASVTATLRSAPVKSGSWHWGRFRGTPNPTEDRTSPLANLCSLPSILRVSPSSTPHQLGPQAATPVHPCIQTGPTPEANPMQSLVGWPCIVNVGNTRSQNLFLPLPSPW